MKGLWGAPPPQTQSAPNFSTWRAKHFCSLVLKLPPEDGSVTFPVHSSASLCNFQSFASSSSPPGRRAPVHFDSLQALSLPLIPAASIFCTLSSARFMGQLGPSCRSCSAPDGGIMTFPLLFSLLAPRALHVPLAFSDSG